MKAKVVLQSQNTKTGNFITTFLLEYPRIIHAELLTHKLFSRNTASSRAVPVNKMLDHVGFVPRYIGQNQRGMSASAEVADPTMAKLIWMQALNDAKQYSKDLADIGVHKQLANRVTEPYQIIQCVVTATCLKNWFNLRDNPAAQPEIRDLAECMKFAYLRAQAQPLAPGEWHLPFVNPDEDLSLEVKLAVSSARCARTSYFNPDDSYDVEKDLGLFKRLISGCHWSPTEHPAIAIPQRAMVGNFIGFMQLRKFFYHESGDDLDVPILNPTQARKMMSGYNPHLLDKAILFS